MATAPRQSQAKAAPAKPDRQRVDAARATAPAQALEALQQRLGNRGMAAWLVAQGSPAVQSLEAAADAFADAMASAAGQALVPGWPLGPQQHRARTRPPGSLLGPMLAGPGTPLAPRQRRAFEQRLGTDLAAVRLHQGPAAQRLARALGARAFALGADIVFGDAAPPAGSLAGQRLLAHELAHVDQQARGQRPPGLPLQLDDDPVAVGAVAAVPDDPAFDAGIDARAEHKNIDWFSRLLLAEAQVQRDLDPYLQPRAYANRVHSAQRLLQQHGVGRVEGARLGADGILGPRTFLALLTVARAPAHAARAPIQGLGFDLDHIAAALRSELAARTYARPAEVRLQLNLQVPGAAAVRWYDRFYAMRALHDQNDFDNTLFGGEAPAGLRREDRVQILHRLYGQGDNRLDGRLEVVVAERDFIHSRLDVAGAVARDRRRGVANAYYFNFVATSPDRFGHMMRALDIDRAIDQALTRLDAAAQQALNEALTLLQTQVDGDIPGAGQTAGVLLALYLPVPDAAAVQAASSAVMAERAEHERQERDRIDANNQAVAVQRADALVAILDDDESNHLLVDARLRTELERAAVERAYFDAVLDELDRRGRFQRLFDRTEAIGGTEPLSLLVRAARAGHWQNHARVRAAQALLIRRSGAVREHRYEVDPAGDPTRAAVLLDGDERLAVGRVAGDVTTAYLRDEDREQLRPAAQQRMTAALETESRAYMEGLLNGNETERSQDEVGRELMARAWAAAGLDPDEDIEDVTWEESVRVLGVRLAPDRGDGVPHYEIEYERVQRITGGEAGTPSWDESPGVDGTRRWGSESEFEYDMFWYAYSQSADVMIGFAKVVTIGAVVAIAWEVGLIGYLVGIAGGPVVVGSSVAISMAFYLITHRRWTLEGLLVAGLEGYLGALGFKLLAPVGAAAGRLALPATLEQVAFRRVVAAWLLRHGTTGALVGGLMGPASLLMQDLLRISAQGGGLSSLASYGRAAGMGMLMGAVFEIGGSTLLAGLFRNADSTVLARLDDVVTTLNGRHPRLTPSEWLAHVGRGLSATRTMLETLMVESQVRGLVTVITERVQQIGRSYLAGARATIHREVIEMAGAHISREALDGLERMVRLGSARLGDDALATILQQARRTPDRIDPWLRFFSGLDDEATAAIAGRSGQLRALLDADAAMALAVRRGGAEVDGLLGARFGHAVADLDAFALRLNRLEASAADSVLEALRTRGTGATPHTLLRAAEAGQALDDELLGGLQRLLQGGTDPARLDAVFEAFAVDQIGPFARAAQTADDAMLTQMREMVAQAEAVEVAWAMRRPVAEAHALLGVLEAGPRSAILDITAQQAQALLAALTPARVNRALSQGAAGPMRGSHLVTLRAELTDASLARYLDWAGAASGRLRAVTRLADGYAMLPGRMPARAPMTAASLVLDTNVSLAINALLGGVPFAELNAGKQGIVNALRRERGLGPYVDPPAGAAPSFDHIVGPGSDLRAPRTTAAELLGDELQFGRANVLDDMAGIGSSTAHPDHADVMAELDAAVIGQAKGVPDRLVVADALLSAPPGGAVVPRLLSADMPVVMGLAEHFGHPVPFAPRRGTHVGVDVQFAADPVYSGGRFMINIRGHLMEVIYR